MFDPKYTITPKLLENITKITVLITELNHRTFPHIILYSMEKLANATSSHASTSIEGNPLPLTEVKKILKQQPAHARDSEKEVLNYNQALEYLNAQTKELPIDQKLILKVQGFVTKELLPKHEVGKFRQVPVVVNNPKTRQIVYLSPDWQEVPKMVTDLTDFVHQNKTELHPLITAGLFHRQFVLIHPFCDGNGRTTRLITKALLARMGLDTFKLFSFENYYNQNVTKYFQQVGVIGDYYDIAPTLDFTEWLEYFTTGIIDELLRVKDILYAETAALGPRIHPQHKPILNYIVKEGQIADRDYAKLTKRAKATRALDFKYLIEEDIIERVGEGRATYYVAKTPNDLV